MNIWITGIAGFLGSHLRDALTAEGHTVHGNDNMLCHTQELDPNYIFDCVNHRKLLSMLELHQTDVLIHCAATAHEGLSNFSPSFVTRNIYDASVSTFSAAIAAGVKRIIFMTSMARYGAQEPPFTEDMRPAPVDPYGIAKVAAEDTLKALCKLHGVEWVIAVPHNIIGPRQRYWDPYRNVAAIMMNRALQGKPLIVYGTGEQKRCFSPIKDCLHSLVKMVNAPIAGEIINIGPDKHDIMVKDLAAIVNEIANNRAGVEHVAARPNEVAHASCSSDKARRLLGYSPQETLANCLADMRDYIKDNGIKPFCYSFPIEIKSELTPKTWTEKLI